MNNEPVSQYKAITNTKIEPTVVSYTHPVKELTDEEKAKENLRKLAMVHTMLPKVKELIDQQIEEIEALKELNTMLKDAIEKRIGMDAERYKWLRAEFAAGRETYLAEGIPSGESLDKYIDGKLK